QLTSTVANAANFNIDAFIAKLVEKDIDAFQDVDLDGNFANLFGDVEAIGSNTLSDTEFSILTIANELSSISVLAESTAKVAPLAAAATPIGVGLGGNGTLVGVASDATLQFFHDDFDDWNPLLDLDSPINVLDSFEPPGIFPGTPNLENPSNGLDFEPIELAFVAEIGGGAGVFLYVTDSGLDGTDTDGDGIVDDFGADTSTTYNFGNLTAEVDTTGDGIVDTTVTDNLLIQIPDGTQFVATQQGDELELLFAGAGSGGSPVLEFGSTTYELASFGYEAQGVQDLIAQFGVNFATANPVLSNSSAILNAVPIAPPSPIPPPEPPPRPDPTPATPVGVGIGGNGTLVGVAGDATLQFNHEDFDDWTPLLDLETPINVLDVLDIPGIFPGTPDLSNPGNGLDFDPLELVLIPGFAAGPGVFQYASDSGFDGTDTNGDGIVDDFGSDTVTIYNFGNLTAEVDTTGDGFVDTTITDNLLVQIPDGTEFVATQQGGVVELVFAGAGTAGSPVLTFGSTTYELASFGYENQGIPDLIAQFGVNFATSEPVLYNPTTTLNFA
ncbi:MAG: hypothetical protein AAF974_06610, partial [Cyanobacteria bacterium P01_E01_bin.34]